MDLIRLLALIGICIVNVAFLVLPIEAAMPRAAELSDQIAALILEALLHAKFYLIFHLSSAGGVTSQAGPHAAAERHSPHNMVAIWRAWRPSCSAGFHGRHLVDLCIAWPDVLADAIDGGPCPHRLAMR